MTQPNQDGSVKPPQVPEQMTKNEKIWTAVGIGIIILAIVAIFVF